jgi:hypothetical protein
VVWWIAVVAVLRFLGRLAVPAPGPLTVGVDDGEDG